MFSKRKKVKLFLSETNVMLADFRNLFRFGKRILNPAVTNALSCSRPRRLVGPVPRTTAPVPSATKRARHERHFRMPKDRRSFRLWFGDDRFSPAPFLRLCACAPLSRSPNHRPKPRADELMVNLTGSVQRPVLFP
jgi:hypothetical protein